MMMMMTVIEEDDTDRLRSRLAGIDMQTSISLF